uniref:Phorbol-12-myristate-13-acetate-induced protein 1 n=1 Tax=Terrapene triunguis TaxID=2587831 RepID=A0A674JUE0_9SAUR
VRGTKFGSRFEPPPTQEAVMQCSLQLRKIGDICNLQQKILNVITKLFCPGT